MNPYVEGGCNDLILSGHSIVMSVFGAAATSTASNTKFSIALWQLTILDYCIIVSQGLHYSVDMFLGSTFTILIWHLAKPIVKQAKSIQVKQKPLPLDASVVALYALPSFLSFLVLAVLPEAFINYFVFSYMLWAVISFHRHGFTHFLQHVLLQVLILGIGAFL